MEKTCLFLIRKPPTSNLELDKYSDAIKGIIMPLLEQRKYKIEQVDPREYGIEDSRLFKQIKSADIMIVDAAAKSMDYLYSLGVRHAITNKPTIILAEIEHVPFDVTIPQGMIHIHKNDIYELNTYNRLQKEISSALDELTLKPEELDYSPVIKAFEEAPRIFLSYAHTDSESVYAVDQWLRDKGGRVDIDSRNFIAGRDIRDEIVLWLRQAGKVICFYSKSSKNRYYTKLERRIVEEFEQESINKGKVKPILIYFRLDDTELPLESSHRLAINAWNMDFESACKKLWRNITEEIEEPKRISLDRYKNSPPWKN